MGFVPLFKKQVEIHQEFESYIVNKYHCGLPSPATHIRTNVLHKTSLNAHWISAELNNKMLKSIKNL